MKYWEKLLSEWRLQKKDGFTIPYVIGSQKFLPENHNYQDIEDLLLDIAHNDSIDIYIKYCASTGDLILGIRDETKMNLSGDFLPFKNKNISSLFMNSFSKDLGNDVESVIETLTDRYQYDIDSEKFSKNGRERGDYLKEESDFIIHCYKEY